MGYKGQKGELKYSQKEYEDYIKSVDSNVTVLGEYKGSSSPVLIQYNNCGHKFKRTTNELVHKKRGCPYCKGVLILHGFNDLSFTAPHIFNLLKDKNDCDYFPHSRKKTYFECPTCGKEYYKSINSVSKYGLKCDNCYDGFSYPEKYFRSLLIQSNIDFESQKVFDFSGTKKYDFYIINHCAIVETHGMQHVENGFHKTKKNRDELENDKLKRRLALNNGINNYYEIDCRYSNGEYIRKSIIKSGVLDLLNVNIDDIDWQKCEIDANNSLTKECWDLWNTGLYTNIEIANILSLAPNTTCHYLNIGNKLGICNYNGKKEREKASAHPVVLTNTGEIFEYMEDAIRKYGRLNISACCRGEIISAGKMPDGTPMVWRYFEDYESNKDYIYSNKVIKKIICIETGKIYNKIIDAANDYGIKDSTINSNLNKRQSYAGRDKNTKMPLHWMYYDEFITSTQEQIDEFVNKTPKQYSSIICINTLKIYPSATQALNCCNLSNVSSITDCCKGKIKTAGIVNGERAVWMYYQDYYRKC